MNILRSDSRPPICRM